MRRCGATAASHLGKSGGIVQSVVRRQPATRARGAGCCCGIAAMSLNVPFRGAVPTGSGRG